jgi:hypothetical protein
MYQVFVPEDGAAVAAAGRASVDRAGAADGGGASVEAGAIDAVVEGVVQESAAARKNGVNRVFLYFPR